MSTFEVRARAIADHLAPMKAAGNQAWRTNGRGLPDDPDREAEYHVLMAHWPDWLVQDACRYARYHLRPDGSPFRPDLGELLAIAAERVSPIPDPGRVLVEILVRLGGSSRPAPAWSHPLMEDVVLYLGSDWLSFRRLYPHPHLNPEVETDLRIRVSHHETGAYWICARRWRSGVAEGLLLPDEVRDRRLFPAPERVAAAPALRLVETAPPAAAPQEADPDPEEALARIREIRESLGARLSMPQEAAS
ncbi:MAG: hypothetical protein JO157_05945 [Acetobacteraceae bacterium]|nr:hypothetical protein [Acetobacteraceae bacterium]